MLVFSSTIHTQNIERELDGDEFFPSSPSSLPPRSLPCQWAGWGRPHPRPHPAHWHGSDRGGSEDGDEEIGLCGLVPIFLNSWFLEKKGRHFIPFPGAAKLLATPLYNIRPELGRVAESFPWTPASNRPQSRTGMDDCIRNQLLALHHSYRFLWYYACNPLLCSKLNPRKLSNWLLEWSAWLKNLNLKSFAWNSEVLCPRETLSGQISPTVSAAFQNTYMVLRTGELIIAIMYSSNSISLRAIFVTWTVSRHHEHRPLHKVVWWPYYLVKNRFSYSYIQSSQLETTALSLQRRRIHASTSSWSHPFPQVFPFRQERWIFRSYGLKTVSPTYSLSAPHLRGSKSAHSSVRFQDDT